MERQGFAIRDNCASFAARQFSTLSFLSLFLGKRQGKPPKNKDFLSLPNPLKSLEKKGKTLEKNKEILTRRKNKEIQKNKERKDRVENFQASHPPNPYFCGEFGRSGIEIFKRS